MLNKQPGDADVTGVGELLEDNFFNLGLADHPLQALNRFARNDPDFRDRGRQEITGEQADAFKFRTLTLRQLRDARVFMHNALFTSVGEVVRYFNAGVPQDAEAGAPSIVSRRFTNPRGPGYPEGLGLSGQDVAHLTDFVENALYDPWLVHYDPRSTTDTFQLNERDLTYSVYRPDLAALGAVDGLMPSGLPQDNNDPLSRRDAGLEFLDVTDRVATARVTDEPVRHIYRLSNSSDTVVDTHLLVVVRDLSAGARLQNASGVASDGAPYVRIFLDNGVLRPGESTFVTLRFTGQPWPSYRLTLLSGQGNP